MSSTPILPICWFKVRGLYSTEIQCYGSHTFQWPYFLFIEIFMALQPRCCVSQYRLNCYWLGSYYSVKQNLTLILLPLCWRGGGLCWLILYSTMDVDSEYPLCNLFKYKGKVIEMWSDEPYTVLYIDILHFRLSQIYIHVFYICDKYFYEI